MTRLTLYQLSVARCARVGHNLVEWRLIGRLLCVCCGRSWPQASGGAAA